MAKINDEDIDEFLGLMNKLFGTETLTIDDFDRDHAEMDPDAFHENLEALRDLDKLFSFSHIDPGDLFELRRSEE